MTKQPLRPHDPKPSYRKAIEDAISDWVTEVGAGRGADLNPDEIKELTGRIMRKMRDEGIVIGLEDGTDYAHRT